MSFSFFPEQSKKGIVLTHRLIKQIVNLSVFQFLLTGFATRSSLISSLKSLNLSWNTARHQDSRKKLQSIQDEVQPIQSKTQNLISPYLLLAICLVFILRISWCIKAISSSWWFLFHAVGRSVKIKIYLNASQSFLLVEKIDVIPPWINNKLR